MFATPIQMEVTKFIPIQQKKERQLLPASCYTFNSMVPLLKKTKVRSNRRRIQFFFYKSKFNDWENPQKVIYYNVEGTLSLHSAIIHPLEHHITSTIKTLKHDYKAIPKGVFILIR